MHAGDFFLNWFGPQKSGKVKTIEFCDLLSSFTIFRGIKQ